MADRTRGADPTKRSWQRELDKPPVRPVERVPGRNEPGREVHEDGPAER